MCSKNRCKWIHLEKEKKRVTTPSSSVRKNIFLMFSQMSCFSLVGDLNNFDLKKEEPAFLEVICHTPTCAVSKKNSIKCGYLEQLTSSLHPPCSWVEIPCLQHPWGRNDVITPFYPQKSNILTSQKKQKTFYIRLVVKLDPIVPVHYDNNSRLFGGTL